MNFLSIGKQNLQNGDTSIVFYSAVGNSLINDGGGTESGRSGPSEDMLFGDQTLMRMTTRERT
jgi:hypothetical protein